LRKGATTEKDLAKCAKGDFPRRGPPTESPHVENPLEKRGPQKENGENPSAPKALTPKRDKGVIKKVNTRANSRPRRLE